MNSGFVSHYRIKAKLVLTISLILYLSQYSFGQFLLPSDTLNKKRVIGITATGAAGYGLGMYLLGNAWYKNSLTSEFRFFNDNGEWLQVDKIGHVFSAYNESRVVYQMYKWAGVSEDNAILLGMGAGALVQTSMEVFDGFSDKWGFSWGDMAGNAIGLGVFGVQQKLWHEQRITFKVSSDYRNYSKNPINPTSGNSADNLHNRAIDLYGKDPASRLLKDYNAQTNWVIINPGAFSTREKKWWPAFISVGLGYSAENLFGGFGNAWNRGGNSYTLSENEFPRYRQYLLSLDVDFTRIPTRSPFLKSVFRVLNIFKVPAPTLEYNRIHGMKWHWIFF